MRRVTVAVVLALFLVVLASSVAYARPNEWYTIAYHTVKPGQTLYSIGRMYGVSPTAIASYNGIVNPDCIYAWQVLAVPNAYGGYWWGPWHPYHPYHPPYAPGYGCACRYRHTVVGGDNVYRLALNYGVSMWQIAHCNHLPNVNYIQLGSTLCIP